MELRPLEVDKTGKNILYNKVKVPEELRVSINFDDNVIGNTCYKKNELYIEKCKIIFNENYENRTDSNYAQGYLIIPLSYVFNEDEREQLSNMSLLDDTNQDVMSDYIQ
jgi:hypothetical protein